MFLECDGPAPGLVERVQEVLPNAVEVRLVYEREHPERTVADFRAMTPSELFTRYYRTQHGSEPADGLITLFNELFEDVSGAPAEA